MSATGSNRALAGADVTALILAGGAGRRIGGGDKGLVPWHGRPLVEHVYERVAAQVTEVLISCNRNREAYSAVASVTARDCRQGYQGPLAGLEAALPQLHREYVLLVPCDMPLLPDDLVARLSGALAEDRDAGVSYARTADDRHYVCALLRRESLCELDAYLDAGGRAVRHWYAMIGGIAVDFSDETDCFLNLNELDAI